MAVAEHKCSECGGRLGDSTIPGLVKCHVCGKVDPAPSGWEGEAKLLMGAATPEPESEPLQVENQHVAIPDEIECVWGWRAWDLSVKPGQPMRLKSKVRDTYWAPRQPTVAKCPKPKATHECPGDNCTCGLYAAKTLEHLIGEMGYAQYDMDSGVVAVVGKVKMWGKVVEGSLGWRAGYAYPAAFYLPFEAWRFMEPLQNEYGADVELANTIGATL
jgi:hypothetical protein